MIREKKIFYLQAHEFFRDQMRIIMFHPIEVWLDQNELENIVVYLII